MEISSHEEKRNNYFMRTENVTFPDINQLLLKQIGLNKHDGLQVDVFYWPIKSHIAPYTRQHQIHTLFAVGPHPFLLDVQCSHTLALLPLEGSLLLVKMNMCHSGYKFPARWISSIRYTYYNFDTVIFFFFFLAPF